MKTVALVVLMFCGSICAAQTKAPATSTLKAAKAETERCTSALQEMTRGMADFAQRNATAMVENDRLTAENARQKKDMDALQAAATEIINDNDSKGRKLTSDYNSLVQQYNELVNKHNTLLDIARSQEVQLQTANSRQQRVNNALALYSIMPRYQPTQNLNIQVTNCAALPALCVH